MESKHGITSPNRNSLFEAKQTTKSKLGYADFYGGLTSDELEEEQRLQQQDMLLEL